MATASDIITSAFAKIRIDSPTTAQNASALISLNNVVSLLGADFKFPYLVSESFSLTIGDYSYTIGSGGDFDTDRPMFIENCYLRDSDSYDYPVKVITEREYARNSQKTLTAMPYGVYYRPEYPLGKIYFTSAPERAYDAYFDFVKNFTEFAASDTDVSLANEYKSLFVYNLAVSLAEDWDRVPSKSVYVMAEKTKEIVGALNAATRPSPKARFDVTKSEEAGSYSVVTDDYLDGGSF